MPLPEAFSFSLLKASSPRGMKPINRFLWVIVCYVALVGWTGCKKRSPAEVKVFVPIPTPTINPSKVGPILFVSDRDYRFQIYTMDPDGSNVIRITMNGNFPSWSPDGSKIAFLRYITADQTSHIFLMASNGTNLVQVTSGKAKVSSYSNLAWSPDGLEIAFSYSDGTGYDIFTINVDGSDLTNITNTVGVSESDPDWSPDGSQIVFTSGILKRLAFMNPDGSGVVTILQSGRTAAWSPDGSRIAFTDPSGSYHIYTMNPDGTGVTQVTSTATGGNGPRWSSDGLSLVFTSGLAGTSNREVFVINVDGSNQTNISNHEAWEQTVDWRW